MSWTLKKSLTIFATNTGERYQNLRIGLNMLKIISPLIASFVLLSLGGCSRIVDGEAYIQDRQVVKMADMEVRLISKEIFQQSLKRLRSFVPGEVDKLQKEIDQLSSYNVSTQARIDKILKDVSSLIKAGSTNVSIVNQAESTIFQLTREISDRDVRIGILKKKISGLKDGLDGRFFFPPDSVDTIAKVRTNSEGKFKLEFKFNEDAVLVAKNSNGYYVWILNLEKNAKSISLTPSNQNSENCVLCKD